VASEVEVIFQEIGDPLELTKWKRNDNGNVHYWNKMRSSLENKLAIWFDLLFPPTDISKFILDFNNMVNEALSCSLKKKNAVSTTNKLNLRFDPHLFYLFRNEAHNIQICRC
jgi:hypothetical protein